MRYPIESRDQRFVKTYGLFFVFLFFAKIIVKNIGKSIT